MMANTALNVQMDSGKAERDCAADDCTSAFHPKKPWQKYCSKKCKSRIGSRAEMVKKGYCKKICVSCGSTFRAERSAKTCSVDCSDREHKKQVREWSLRNRPDGITCVIKWAKKNPEKVKKAEREYGVKFRHIKREQERKRAASAALSAILLPVQAHPEVNQ